MARQFGGPRPPPGIHKIMRRDRVPIAPPGGETVGRSFVIAVKLHVKIVRVRQSCPTRVSVAAQVERISGLIRRPLVVGTQGSGGLASPGMAGSQALK